MPKKLLAFNLAVWRPELEARIRKVRRLAYLAAIAQQVGYEVVIHAPPGSPEYFEPLIHDSFGFVRRIISPMNVYYRSGPIQYEMRIAGYFCSSGTLAQGRKVFPHNDGKELKKTCPVIGLKEYTGCKLDPVAAQFCDVLVAYTSKKTDFTDVSARQWPDRLQSDDKIVTSKIYSVPWIPFDSLLATFEVDGMDAYYRADDLSAIRARYRTNRSTKIGSLPVGFIGFPSDTRRRIAGRIKSRPGGEWFNFLWSDGRNSPKMDQREYLAWLTECQAVLDLPGETWKCSRFSEAAMMGVPIITRDGMVRIWPPISQQNTICVRSLTQPRPILERLNRAKEIAAQADRDYLAGWSLRAQFFRMLKKSGITP